jgi:signal transduction histidine kinase/CHASE2 domain-containing sensor protein/CheY-like chemotaxis protein
MHPNHNSFKKSLAILLKSSWRWLPGLAAVALTIFLLRLEVWEPFERLAYRQTFRLRGMRALDSRIVVVAIDDASLSKIGEFPWPRQRYLGLLKKIQQSQPRVVGFTFPFTYDSTADSEMSDSHNVVLADWDSRGIPIKSKSKLKTKTLVGHVQSNEDFDGVARAIPLRRNNQPAFAVEVVRAAQYTDPIARHQTVGNNNDLLINWGSAAPAITTYSIADVMRPDFKSQLLANKIVLVGVTAKGIDRIGTPFDRNSSGNGVYLQATVIDNLLQHKNLQTYPEPLFILLLFIFSPFLSWQLSYHSHGRRLIAVLLIGVGWVLLATVGLYFNYLIWVAVPIALIGLTGIAVAFSEKFYVDSLIDRQILQLWQAYQIDLIDRQPATPGYPNLPSFARVSKLAAMATDFGRAQSAQAAITHSLSLGLVATELNGTVWFCNSVASCLLQINIGENIDQCLIPQWLSAAEWQANLHNLNSCTYIPPREIQQGEQFFMLKVEPLLNWPSLERDIDDGKETLDATVVSGVLLVIEEITASKRLQSLMLDVEIQRRQELTKQNIALNKAKQLAESAANIKSAFLANMSHEIRTPMNAVVGLTNLLLETPLNYEQKDFVSTIQVSADHLLKIINEILDFSKLESGEMRLESIAFNLSQLIEQVIEILANSAQYKGLSLSYWIDPATPMMVEGDPTRLNQILTNLIGNAIKFTEQGGVTINVQPCPDSTSHVKIIVTDTGIGISPENQHKLFQSFSQADTSTTRKYGGTGLGLAICQRLLELMSGEIGLDSVVNQGSSFWFTVPLITLSIPTQIQPPILHQVSILIVDTWPHQLQSLAKNTTQWGMSPITSNSVTPDILDAHTPQIALIDWKKGGSHQLIEKIWEQQIPIIVMTTFDRYESARSKLGDRVSYLFKPIKPLRLNSLLQELLAPSSQIDIIEELFEQLDTAPSRSNLSHLNILLAEDNQINQKVALRQLAKLGYQVDVANNGQEVLDKLYQKHYELILMDCHMPVLDGYATTEAIRQLPSQQSQSTVIIALTASAMESDLEYALAVGMNDFLSKPVKIEQLQQMIEKWLSH